VSGPLLELRDFSIELGGRVILRGLGFALARAERVAVVGPNGAGKSTLLKCLARILSGARGEARLDGRALAAFRQDELARRVAYVPQAAGVSIPFTVEEFLFMGRYPHLGPIAAAGERDRGAVERALKDTGTLELRERYLDTLSGGERQKVFLAAALAQEAELLLLDEHTAFLDPHHQVEIQRVLRRVHDERGTALLAVTHDLNGALAHFERVLALREGEIRFDGPSSAFAEPAILRDVFRHDFVIARHPSAERPIVLPE
jgi:iron complex transport system ATP-binding protein